MKIVIPEHIDILKPKYINQLKKLGQVKTYLDFPQNQKQTVKRIRDAQVLIVKWLRLSEDLLKKTPNLKHIITLSSGYSTLPTTYASQNNITVSNCPTHNSQAVAEHVLALILTVNRRVVEAQTNIQKGTWRQSQYSYQGNELTGKKLGIIGFGSIGRKVTQLTAGFNVKVKGLTSRSNQSEFTKLISESDYILLSLPYSPKVKNLISEKQLKKMKNSTVLINISRGDIVDQKALIKALKNGWIRGAGIDVAQGEVIKGKAPENLVTLSRLKNIVITPHIAYNTQESAARMGKEMVANVKAILKGSPINVVN